MVKLLFMPTRWVFCTSLPDIYMYLCRDYIMHLCVLYMYMLSFYTEGEREMRQEKDGGERGRGREERRQRK